MLFTHSYKPCRVLVCSQYKFLSQVYVFLDGGPKFHENLGPGGPLFLWNIGPLDQVFQDRNSPDRYPEWEPRFIRNYNYHIIMCVYVFLLIYLWTV